MTNEEAIQVLNIVLEDEICPDADQFDEALHIAIKAIEFSEKYKCTFIEDGEE